MQEYRVVFSEDADNDLESIVVYLSEFSPGIAHRYYEEIISKSNTLSTMPERCNLVSSDELRAKGYRWLFVRNYTVFFTIHKDENAVVIRRILYARREYTALI